MKKQYYVYILASKKYGVLYIGMTDNLIRRIYEHKSDSVEGFTNNYHVHILVYFEMFTDPLSAITREKQLKKWKRAWKIRSIEENNPDWRDLYSEIIK
jgi:putative endonuclease